METISVWLSENDGRLYQTLKFLAWFNVFSSVLFPTDYAWDYHLLEMLARVVYSVLLPVNSEQHYYVCFLIAVRAMMKFGISSLFIFVLIYSFLTVIVGEIANFAAYAFAPAILVTPLGALSIIFSAVLAHFILKEKLHIFGVLGCVLCVVGSTSIVLHAPQERAIESVKEVWHLATEPGFLVYSGVVLVVVSVLIFRFVPLYGQTHMIVYVGICSLMGSITVMSVKALGIALKLTFSGSNQFIYYQTWLFTIVVFFACLLQINYLNKALDTFNTAVISPVYYVMFTSLTILASMIMFKDWNSQNASQIVTEVCGFITILSGTFLLHRTKDMGNAPISKSSPETPVSTKENSTTSANTEEQQMAVI